MRLAARTAFIDTLILKNVSGDGWAFAGHRASRKAEQLSSQPAAALNFWWQPIVRAVRVRGAVQEASRAKSDADLAARSAAAHEGIDPADWVLWRLVPSRIEFWTARSTAGTRESCTFAKVRPGRAR
ncbi:pyridoxamine 5'-phosphate oxidase family protein [Microbacterium sp. AK031]|uniref:pyridoxamine 5'-phosphate oxidase family protein n=1 Tax=Microbacterium sp. AK031 TaxID=2723076 RepID=UPI0021683914|nr:pyridoxamine 5'-phosphate oxidase family protein [Microbacterium sp. AK031]MCS3844844.1 pyridoxine/pyridoxamine 5'-phosphate oxidase [Microbacterium sp. AK031]